MNTPPAPTTHLPAGFHLWWAVSTLHAAGSSMLAFALIWLATGHGPAAVALVSTVSVLPSLCLLLLGGALGDRHGPRSLLVATTLAQLAVLLGLLVLVGDDPGLAGLAAAAGALSVISAFQQPAAIVFPRLLITREEQFSRALARISGSTHIARILGVSFGGIAISVWPLAALLAVCAFLAGLSLVVLTALRPSAPTPPREGRPTGLWHALCDGFRSAHALRIWPLLAAVALVCAAVLPVVAVVLPSAARAQGWSGSEAGLLEAAWATGTLTVTLLVSFVGTVRAQHRALIGGPLLMMAALAALALSFAAPLALPTMLGASALLGVGTAVFTTHIAPMLLRRAPAGQMMRFQSLMAIVQLAPPALLNSPLAALAGSGHASLALLLAAALAGSAALLIAADSRATVSQGTAPAPPPAPRAATRGPS
ncbi:MAG: MFS transporter [Dermabacteraceae bacterium]